MNANTVEVISVAQCADIFLRVSKRPEFDGIQKMESFRKSCVRAPPTNEIECQRAQMHFPQQGCAASCQLETRQAQKGKSTLSFRKISSSRVEDG